MATIHSITDCPPLPEVEGVEVRHVPGFPGYSVGDDGNVWSAFTRTGQGTWGYGHEWRKLHPYRGNYYIIAFHRHGTYVRRLVHRLVLEVFIGPCPKGLEACHGNGDSHDNRLQNLRWDTSAANYRDTVRHGNHICGQRHPNAKLLDADVKHVKELGNHLLQREIAELYGVSVSLISLILKGQHRNRKP